MKAIQTEISKSTRKFIEQTKYGHQEVTETRIISKQTWPTGSGIYSGLSYELGNVFRNGQLVDSWSTPWKGGNNEQQLRWTETAK